MVRALREQAVDEVGVQPVGREDRLRDALRRVLVEVESGGAERDVEVDDDGLGREATVDEPTPPLEPMTATVRPSGEAPGFAKRCEAARTKSSTPMGAMRYSLTPLPIISR